MITLAAMVVLAGPVIAWALQGVPIPEGGKLAAEWISPAILCGVLVKLLWDERADAREARRLFDAKSAEQDKELRSLIEKTTAALEKVSTLLHDNTAALNAVHQSISFCRETNRNGD